MPGPLTRLSLANARRNRYYAETSASSKPKPPDAGLQMHRLIDKQNLI
jgi:hypothetical protein